MNAIFSYTFIVATAVLLITNPDLFLKSALHGAEKSATVCLAMLSSYALWLGLISVWEKSGVSEKISKLLTPLVKKLFKTQDEPTVSAISMNLAVNFLGIGGAGTPYGVKACRLLDNSENAEYSSAMFFVVNATSVQLLPTAIVGVRVSMGSLAPSNIILPSILASALSTLVGVGLTSLYFALKPKAKREKRAPNIPVLRKMKGVGAR